MKLRLVPSIVCLALSLVGLSACASDSLSAAEPASSDSATAGVPEFSGPYAEEFRTRYSEASSEVVREVLRDEVISEAEAQAILEEFRTCLAAQGITLDSYDDDGVAMTGDPSKIKNSDLNARAEECSRSSHEADVLTLYQVIKRDPEKAFTLDAVVACYIRAELVPSTYSVEDYKNSRGLSDLYPGDMLAEPSGQATLDKIQACDADPLTAYVE